MVNESQRSAEIPLSKVFDIERRKLLEQLAGVINENARLQAANEAIIERVRELEQRVESGDEQMQRMVHTNQTLVDRIAAYEATEADDDDEDGDGQAARRTG